MSDTAASVERANRSIVRLAMATALVSLAAVVITLVWFYSYVHSGRGVSCQTNGLIRELISLVDGLIHAVNTHAHTVKLPPSLTAPTGCGK